MAWEDIIKKLDEKIRVGDYVETERGGLLGSKVTYRSGVITEIRIAMVNNDAAGEYDSAVKVEEYDLSLDYQGSISYGYAGNSYWTYLEAITKVVPKEKLNAEGFPKEEME